MALVDIVRAVVCDWENRTGLFRRRSCNAQTIGEDELEQLLNRPLSERARYGWQPDGSGPYDAVSPPVVIPPGTVIRPAIKLFTNNPIAIGLQPVQLFLDNPSRQEVIIVNVSTAVIYLGLGSVPAQPNQYDVALAACTTANDGTGGSYISQAFTGTIWAVANATGGSVAIKES